MFLLWHPWLTTTNLSYSFPLLETSATALCGTTGKNDYMIFTQTVISRVLGTPIYQYCWWFRNPANQLRLVDYPIIYKVLAPSQVVGNGISEPSTVPVPVDRFELCQMMFGLELSRCLASAVIYIPSDVINGWISPPQKQIISCKSLVLGEFSLNHSPTWIFLR